MYDNYEKVLFGNNVQFYLFVCVVGGGGDFGDFFNLWYEFFILIKIVKIYLKNVCFYKFSYMYFLI